MKIMKIKVTGTGKSATQMEVRSGKFSMIIDEPEQMGGTGTGPSPVQLILFALAGCLNMTGNFVAREMGLSFRGLKVEISGELNPCKFMGISDDERAGFRKIEVTIIPETDTDISPSLLENWLREVETRCPVTDNIKEATKIAIKLATKV